MQQLPAAISKGVNTEFTRLLLKSCKKRWPCCGSCEMLIFCKCCYHGNWCRQPSFITSPILVWMIWLQACFKAIRASICYTIKAAHRYAAQGSDTTMITIVASLPGQKIKQITDEQPDGTH